MTYNGHPNWASWNVALWIGNVEPLYRLFKEVGQLIFEKMADDEGIGTTQMEYLDDEYDEDAFNEAVQTASRAATLKLAHELEARGAEFWFSQTDLSNYSEFASVDWEDVAEGILEEAHFTTDEDREVEWTFPVKEEA